MNSFICWIGGKKVLRKTILEQFPQEITRYIEVFGGAGWVLFAKEKHAEMEVFNDIDGELVNLFRCVKHHCEAVQKELEYMFCSREQFFDFKSQLQTSGLTDIQRAARYFFLIKESFGADKKSFRTDSTNLQKSIHFLSEASIRLNNVMIEKKDFESLIKIYDRPEALFYCDPPYWGTEHYYKYPFKQEDHIRLRETLGNIKGKFVLSYQNDETIKDLYKGFSIIEVSRKNTLAANSNTSEYKELIIKNF